MLQRLLVNLTILFSRLRGLHSVNYSNAVIDFSGIHRQFVHTLLCSTL